MKSITIDKIPGYQEWRKVAKNALEDGISPEKIFWGTGQDVQSDLFTTTPPGHQKPNSNHDEFSSSEFTITKPQKPLPILQMFLKLCETALCHQSPERFSLCYRVLWRLANETTHLLSLTTDNDILRLNELLKAVRRDAYKMTAFLRFRGINHHGTEYFIAWYEPEHYTLELKLDFFTRRFTNMRWSILTPYRAAHWDTKVVTLEDNPDPSVYPREDTIEKYWLAYYAHVFNPARPKKDAMMTQMPKKYWKNMPETDLIDDLLMKSEARTREMLKKS